MTSAALKELAFTGSILNYDVPFYFGKNGHPEWIDISSFEDVPVERGDIFGTVDGFTGKIKFNPPIHSFMVIGDECEGKKVGDYAGQVSAYLKIFRHINSPYPIDKKSRYLKLVNKFYSEPLPLP